MDAVLAHFWTVFADAFHGHMLFRASFQAYPMAQDKVSFTRVTVGSISLACSARGAAALTNPVFCVEASRKRREIAIGPIRDESQRLTGLRRKGKAAAPVSQDEPTRLTEGRL